MKLRVIVVVLCLLITQCNPELKDIVGKYYARHGRGTEYVELKPDYTYVHVFHKGTLHYKRAGTWSLERKTDFSLLYICLTNWQDVVNSYYNPININQNRRDSIALFYFGEKGVIGASDVSVFNFHKEEKK